jgi:hypothetical protein
MASAIIPDSDTILRDQYINALSYNATSYRQIHEMGLWSGSLNLSWAKNNL